MSAYIGVVVLLLTPIAYALLSQTPPEPHTRDGNHIIFKHVLEACYALMFGVLLGAWLLQPALSVLLSRVKAHWRPLYTALVQAAICVFFAGFIIHEGRHQFGGFDFSIIIDTGWRQILGQHLYTDFVATTPPGFDLGIKYAFQLFGVSWNANLYFTAIVACITMLWMYWLMRQVGFSILAALGTAFAIECQTMLLLSYWWYNNSVLILAAVFLLCCVACLKRPQSKGVQVSYVVALALFLLMKPNVAGIEILGGLTLLFLGSTQRMRIAVLTLASGSAALAILAMNHISLLALLSSYHEASKARGGFSLFGFKLMSWVERIIALLALAAFSIPGLWVFPCIARRLRERDLRSAALLLFFPLALLVSAYSLMTNGDSWLVEFPPLLVMAAFFCFSQNLAPLSVRRLITSVICAVMAVSVCMGVLRYRVYLIGPMQFFEWTNNENRIVGGFLNDMRVGAPMVDMEHEIDAVVHSNPGPYFFGPRIDFNFAVEHLPSPDHFPAWWYPGDAFGLEQEPHLIQVWEDHHFQTLIFLKGDYSFYSPAFMSAIQHEYVADHRYPLITVYHRRPSR